MEQRPLGSTGVWVSEQCLGAMMFGALGNRDHEECTRIVHRALDAGITFINTADGYSAGESEEVLGEALTDGRRAEVVLSVKFGLALDGNHNHGGASRRWITQAVEGSLRRLRTDWIDVYEVGVPDEHTDLDETLGALTDLVSAGAIRSFGTSKMPPSRLVEARWLAERRGHGTFRTEEVPYSMINRAVEYDLLPTCQRLGTGVLAFGALGGGWLSGRYQQGTGAGPASSLRARRGRMDADAPGNAAKLAAAQALGALAAEAGMSLIQLATAFVLHHPGVSSAAIVPAGASLDVADTMWEHGTRALQPSRRPR